MKKKPMLYAFYCTFEKLVTFFKYYRQIDGIMFLIFFNLIFFYKQYVDIGRIWNLKSQFLILFYKFIFDEQYCDIGRI